MIRLFDNVGFVCRVISTIATSTLKSPVCIMSCIDESFEACLHVNCTIQFRNSLLAIKVILVTMNSSQVYR